MYDRLRPLIVIVTLTVACGRDLEKYCGEALDSSTFVIVREQEARFALICPTMDEAAIRCAIDAKQTLEHAQCVARSSITVRPGGVDDPERAALCQRAQEHGSRLTRASLDEQRPGSIKECVNRGEGFARCLKHAPTCDAILQCMTGTP